MSSPGMGLREWLLLIVLSLLWGCSFFYFKVLVAELPPLTIVLGRVAIAALVLNGVLLARGQSLGQVRSRWGSFAIMGSINNIVPFSLIVAGETQISSGLASILNATTPIFAVLAAQCLTRDEKLNWHKSIGVVFGFGGVVLLMGPLAATPATSGIGSHPVAGEIACILAAVSYALAGIYSRRFKGVPALTMATGQITASALILVPVVALIDRPWELPLPSTHAWAALLALALLSTALAYIIFFKILASAGATNVLLVTLLVPVSALLLGRVFLGESLNARILLGMASIGAGLAAMDGRIPAQLLKRAARRA